MPKYKDKTEIKIGIAKTILRSLSTLIKVKYDGHNNMNSKNISITKKIATNLMLTLTITVTLAMRNMIIKIRVLMIIAEKLMATAQSLKALKNMKTLITVTFKIQTISNEETLILKWEYLQIKRNEILKYSGFYVIPYICSSVMGLFPHISVATMTTLQVLLSKRQTGLNMR